MINILGDSVSVDTLTVWYKLPRGFVTYNTVERTSHLSLVSCTSQGQHLERCHSLRGSVYSSSLASTPHSPKTLLHIKAVPFTDHIKQQKYSNKQCLQYFHTSHIIFLLIVLKNPNNFASSILVHNHADGTFTHQPCGPCKYQARLDVTEFLVEMECATEYLPS